MVDSLRKVRLNMSIDRDTREMLLRTYEGAQYRFIVLARKHVSRIAPDEPYIVISITDPNTSDANVAESPNRTGLLRFKFNDTGDYGQPLRDTVVMTADHARQILDFVADHKKDVSTIICQCEAGMSRSAGVAAALSHILQGQNKYFYANFEPNKWVYRTIIDEQQRQTLSD
jgi:predicted protein tyrosine phosphatase